MHKKVGSAAEYHGRPPISRLQTEMSKWKKQLNVQHFAEKIKCPYCEEDFASNLALCQHVLREHNWNKDFLKGFEIVETIGPVMIVRETKKGT